MVLGSVLGFPKVRVSSVAFVVFEIQKSEICVSTVSMSFGTEVDVGVGGR